MCLQTVEQENGFLSKAGSASSAGWRSWEEGSGRFSERLEFPSGGDEQDFGFLNFIYLFFFA